jgi:hypothetical protein
MDFDSQLKTWERTLRSGTKQSSLHLIAELKEKVQKQKLSRYDYRMLFEKLLYWYQTFDYKNEIFKLLECMVEVTREHEKDREAQYIKLNNFVVNQSFVSISLDQPKLILNSSILFFRSSRKLPWK